MRELRWLPETITVPVRPPFAYDDDEKIATTFTKGWVDIVVFQELMPYTVARGSER